MGRCTAVSAGPPMCAACGRAKRGRATGRSESPRERFMALNVGTSPVGDVRRAGALGHPQSGSSVLHRAGSGDE